MPTIPFTGATVNVAHKTRNSKLWITRDFDATTQRFRNSYTISLNSDDTPLPGKEVEVWYVARDTPGYDSWNSQELDQRIKAGGKIIKLRTAKDGTAKLNLPEFGGIESIHASYQTVVWFNTDHSDLDYKSSQLPQLEYYANSGLDP